VHRPSDTKDAPNPTHNADRAHTPRTPILHGGTAAHATCKRGAPAAPVAPATAGAQLDWPEFAP
jgi:hypothetical protein